MPLKCFFPNYEQKNLFLSLYVRLRTISIFRIKVLANWASWISTRLFLCPHIRSLNGFIPGLMLLSARIKRSKYINLSLVFEKAFESFRMNNQKTQCEQCLRVDNSRSGYSEFSLIGCGIAEARWFIYTAKGKQRITSLLSYLWNRRLEYWNPDKIKVPQFLFRRYKTLTMSAKKTGK